MPTGRRGQAACKTRGYASSSASISFSASMTQQEQDSDDNNWRRLASMHDCPFRLFAMIPP